MIRLAITQPDIRPYRLPVYNLLAQQPDIELTLFAGHAPDAPDPDPEQVQFEFHHAPVIERKRGPVTLKYQQAQLEVVDPSRFDLVIQSWNAHYRTLWPALRRARRQKLPTVVWGHGYSKRDSWLRTSIRNRMGRRAAGVMLYTHPVAQRLIERYRFDPERVFVAQNAIDQRPIAVACHEWLERREELIAFQQQHRLEPNQTIVFVSRLLRENRPDLLLEAVAQLTNRLPEVSAILVGDGPERTALTEQAAALGIAERVHFPGAIYDERSLAPWMLSSGVFCYPENVGLSLLTAFGFGLPVVTSDNLAAQNPEIAALRPGENGLLYPTGSVSGLADALYQVLEDAAFRQRLSVAAQQTVGQTFTLANMVQGFLDTTRLVDGIERRVVMP